jgi:hypothetical protein
MTKSAMVVGLLLLEQLLSCHWNSKYVVVKRLQMKGYKSYLLLPLLARRTCPLHLHFFLFSEFWFVMKEDCKKMTFKQ